MFAFFTPLRMALIAGLIVVCLAAITGFSIYVDRMQSQLIRKAEQAASEAAKAEVAIKSAETLRKAQEAAAKAMDEFAARNAKAAKDAEDLLTQTNGIPEDDTPQDPVAEPTPPVTDKPVESVNPVKPARDATLDAVNRANAAADRLLERASRAQGSAAGGR